MVVRTPIGRLVGLAPAGPMPVGQSVTVAIAEALSIGTPGGANADRFVATLERQVFLGESRQLHLRGPATRPSRRPCPAGKCRDSAKAAVDRLGPRENVVILQGSSAAQFGPRTRDGRRDFPRVAGRARRLVFVAGAEDGEWALVGPVRSRR